MVNHYPVKTLRAFISYDTVARMYVISWARLLFNFRIIDLRGRAFFRASLGTNSVTISAWRAQLYIGVGEQHSPFSRADQAEITRGLSHA